MGLLDSSFRMAGSPSSWDSSAFSTYSAPSFNWDSNLDFSGAFVNSPAEQSQTQNQQSGFFGQLGQNLQDPLKKAAYALGYRTTGGRFPSAEESGLFPKEKPENKDYSQSPSSSALLEEIIKGIINKRQEEAQNPVLTPPGSTGPRPRSSDSIGAFGSGFNLL